MRYNIERHRDAIEMWKEGGDRRNGTTIHRGILSADEFDELFRKLSDENGRDEDATRG